MNTKKVYQRNPEEKIRVTFFSNGPRFPTGYGKVIREITTRLNNDPDFEVSIIDELLINQSDAQWNGMPVYGLQLPNGDRGQTAAATMNVLNKIRPHIIVFLEDSFTLHNFGFEGMIKAPCKRVFYIPLDGDWIPETGIKVIRTMDELVAMSKFTANSLKKEGFDSEVIWHGVDTEKFCPVSKDEQNALKEMLGFKKDDFLIYNYGRNSNIRKNNQGLLWIIAKYLSEAPDNHHFLIHTLEPDFPGNSLFDYVSRHLTIEFGEDVIKRIHFSPFRQQNPANDEQVAAMMKAADLVVTASTGEGFGLIMAEAMACAKPIISNDYTTPVELLAEEVDGITARGFVVPYEAAFVAGLNTEHAYVSKEEFVDMIKFVVNNPEEAERRAWNGRLFAEKYLNWEYLVQQWKELFRRIL